MHVQVLVLNQEDWDPFYSWQQFVGVATSGAAAALVISVPVEDASFTLQVPLSNQTPITHTPIEPDKHLRVQIRETSYSRKSSSGRCSLSRQVLSMLITSRFYFYYTCR